MDKVLGFMLLLLFAAICLYVYFLPAIVAARRGHINRTAITVLNIALGWTFLGWVAALVWANTANVEARTEERDLADRPDPSWMRNPTLNLDSARAVSVPAVKSQPAEKVCPFCAETIKAAAIVCKHCGRELPATAGNLG